MSKPNEQANPANWRGSRREFVAAVGATTAGFAPSLSGQSTPAFQSNWRGSRVWVGNQYWANPLQDWRVHDGEVIAQAAAGRTLHLLTHQVEQSSGGFQIEATVRVATRGERSDAAAATWAGFEFGIRGGLPGYQHALVHPATSAAAGLRGDGRVFLGDQVGGDVSTAAAVRLTLTVQPSDSSNKAILTAQALSGGEPTSVSETIDGSRLPGNVALAAQARRRPGSGTSGVEWGFRDWTVTGPQIAEHPEQTFGPILWTQYTLSRRTLKLVAHFPPLGAEDEREARLEARLGGAWRAVSSEPIDPLSRTAVFRVPDWDDSRDTDYRVVYSWNDEVHHWAGIVRKDPAGVEQLKIGVFSCDHGEVFPQHRMVHNVSIHDPDVVFFAGDQIYEGYGGFGVARGKPSEEAMLDYLRKYWQFGWSWRTILKDRPSIIIPDDHDVFQGNIWGQAGRALPSSPGGTGFDNGGYLMNVDWVNAVQRTQAGHLPDPVDPKRCDSGIEVYFTEMNYGGASFAILEDRKFKTGPADVLTAKQRAAGRRSPQVLDVKGAEMLGPRQETFLREWVRDSSDADFRIVCSQTIFCKATTHSGGQLNRSRVDLDCGGWPQTARNRALSILNASTDVIMLHGDQHIGSLVQHGVEDWEDGPIALMVPGTSNGFPRAWWPDEPGANRQPGSPQWTGRYFDGLGNRMTVLAAANPEPGSNTQEGQAGLDAEEVAHLKGSGYGLVILDRSKGSVRFEIWRYDFDAEHARSEDQFEGFPIELPLRG